MERVASSRLTVALAIAAIVAVIGMLVAGVLSAPTGDDSARDESWIGSSTASAVG